MRVFWARLQGPPIRHVTIIRQHRYVVTELTEGATVTAADARDPLEVVASRRFGELGLAFDFVTEHAARMPRRLP